MSKVLNQECLTAECPGAARCYMVCVSVSVYVYVCVWVWVSACVCERERKKERGVGRETEKELEECRESVRDFCTQYCCSMIYKPLQLH